MAKAERSANRCGSSGMMDRAKQMRERAAAFAELAKGARDSVVHAELQRLAVLYEGQAQRIERGEDLASDPGEGG
jgi:hypothetical protein